MNRASARAATGDSNGAIEDYSEMIAGDHLTWFALCGRAGAKYVSGDFAGAAEDCQLAMADRKYSDGGGVLHVLLGEALEAQGNIEGAIAEFREAIADHEEAVAKHGALFEYHSISVDEAERVRERVRKLAQRLDEP